MSSNKPTDLSTSFSGMRVSERGGDRQRQHSGGSRGSGSSGSQRGGRRHGGERSGQRGTMAGDMAPIASADMEYKTQTFATRPEKTITEAGSDKVYPEKPLVVANYFKLKAADKLKVYQYDLKYYNPKEQEMRKREDTREIFWEICMSDKYGGIFPQHTRMLFNDINLLWCLDQLKLGANVGEKVIKQEVNRREYTMVIKFTGFIEIDTTSMDADKRNSMIHFIDSAVTQRLRSKAPGSDGRFFTSHGHSIFYHPLLNRLPGFAVNLGMGLQALTGLHGAVKPSCRGGMLYNVDISHSVFYKQSINALEFAIEVLITGKCEPRLNAETADGWRRKLLAYKDQGAQVGLNNFHRKRLNDFFKGMKFRTTYRETNREYQYKAICNRAAAVEEFDYNGKRITVEQYFHDEIRRPLLFPLLPCIQVGKGAMIPLEMLETTVIPMRFKGQVPERVLSTMVRETAWTPGKRFEAIQEMCREDAQIPSHLAAEDVYMRNFGVTVDKTFQTVKSTILPVPTLQFGMGRTFTDGNHDGIWNLTEKKGNGLEFKPVVAPLQTKVLVSMVSVVGGGTGPVNYMQYGTLMKTLYEFGVDVHVDCRAAPINFYEMRIAEVGDVNALNDHLAKFKALIAHEDKYKECVPLMLFLLPYKSTTRRVRLGGVPFSQYGMIKYLSDVKIGINSQCILRTVYDRITNSLACATAHNLTLKIMAKLGIKHYNIQSDGDHKNWTKLTNPAAPTLILGVDVTHPGILDRKEGEHAALSVACVVGNTDIGCLQYDTSVRVQNVGQERTVNMKDEIKRRVTAFFEKNKIYPAQIVVYRDGVSESEFQRTLFEEKKSIKDACQELDPDYQPKLTYIMVSKRHHTRFALPKDQKDPTNIVGATNVKSGTLIEGVITSNSYFDFFLVSHHGALGTSRPAHYYVLHDEWQPSYAFWPNITHALTYAYVRCPRSISQPAPVMYAHLAAKRAKEYLNAYTIENQNNRDNISPYEQFIKMNKDIQRNADLQGMIFL